MNFCLIYCKCTFTFWLFCGFSLVRFICGVVILLILFTLKRVAILVRRTSALKLKCDAWLRPNQPRDVRQDIITRCVICYFTRTWSVIYHLDFRDTWTSLTFNESWQTWHHFLFFFVLFFTPDLIFVELHGTVNPNNCNTIGRSQSKIVQICTRTTSFSVILLILSTDIFGSVSDHIEIRLSYIISERMSSQTVETTRLVILILCRVATVILVNNYH